DLDPVAVELVLERAALLVLCQDLRYILCHLCKHRLHRDEESQPYFLKRRGPLRDSQPSDIPDVSVQHMCTPDQLSGASYGFSDRVHQRSRYYTDSYIAHAHSTESVW